MSDPFMHIAFKHRAPAYGWEPRRSQPWWRRAAMWFGLASATALVFSLAASVVTPGLPYRAARALQRHYAPRPPISKLIVSEYVKETREANIWDRTPVIFPPAVSYFEHHFAAFDPRLEHLYRKTKFQLWIPQLLHEAPIFVGFPVEVAGVIRSTNVLGPAMSNLRVEWIVQLGGITVEHSGLVYCRITRPALGPPPKLGDIVTVSGLVLGVGPIRTMDGERDHAVYMICSGMRQPTGRFGRYARALEHHPKLWSRLTTKY